MPAGDRGLIAKSVLESGNWKKFIKYTLRLGLRVLDECGDSACAALALVTNVWRLLIAAESCEQVLAETQRVCVL